MVKSSCFVFNVRSYNLNAASVPPSRLSNDTDFGTGAAFRVEAIMAEKRNTRDIEKMRELRFVRGLSLKEIGSIFSLSKEMVSIYLGRTGDLFKKLKARKE